MSKNDRNVFVSGVVPGAMLVLALLGLWSPGAVADDDDIVIHDSGKAITKEVTRHDAGPTDLTAGVNVGNILNGHYYPGLEFYRKGNFRYAKRELDYVLGRPEYTRNNPKQREFFSTGHYLRGLIYLDHATGLGRLARAKSDFESCLKWEPGFHSAYLALARLWKQAGDESSARAVLEHLIEQDPDALILQQANEMLGRAEDRAGCSESAPTGSGPGN